MDTDTHNDLHDDIGHSVLGVIPSDTRSEKDHHGKRVHQSRIKDDTHDADPFVGITWAPNNSFSDLPQFPNDKGYITMAY